MFPRIHTSDEKINSPDSTLAVNFLLQYMGRIGLKFATEGMFASKQGRSLFVSTLLPCFMKCSSSLVSSQPDQMRRFRSFPGQPPFGWTHLPVLICFRDLPVVEIYRIKKIDRKDISIIETF